MIVKIILTSFTKINVCLLDEKEIPVHVGQHSFSFCTIVDSGQFNTGQTSVPQDMLPSLKKSTEIYHNMHIPNACLQNRVLRNHLTRFWCCFRRKI